MLVAGLKQFKKEFALLVVKTKNNLGLIHLRSEGSKKETALDYYLETIDFMQNIIFQVYDDINNKINVISKNIYNKNIIH